MTIVHYDGVWLRYWPEELGDTQTTDNTKGMDESLSDVCCEASTGEHIVRFSRIVSDDRELGLRHELIASLLQEDGLWSCEVGALRLMGYGNTVEEALARFQEDFVVTYDGLASEPDESLTPGARELRDRILALVACIEPVSSSQCTTSDNPVVPFFPESPTAPEPTTDLVEIAL